MYNNLKTKLKKILILFLVIALTYSNFLLIGTSVYKGLVSYATTDDFQSENEEVLVENVQNNETFTQEQSEIERVDAVTKAYLSLDNIQWEAGKENIVNFQITLDTKSQKTAIYKDPILILELPECVEKVNAGNSIFNIENDGGAFIKKNVSVVQLLGIKYIIMQFQGEQTQDTILKGNTIINLSLAFNLKEVINENQTAKLYYRNGTLTTYESGMSYGTDIINLDVNAIKGVVIVNSLEEEFEDEENIDENAPSLRTRGAVLTANTQPTTTINENTTGAEIINALNGNNSILLNKSIVAQNKYIYCRNKNQILPSGDFHYIIDTSAPSVTYPNSNKQGAAWAYLFTKNYNNGSATTIAGSDMQNLFWAATNNEQNGYTELIPKNYNNDPIIQEAIAYGNVISEYNGELTVPNSINCEDEVSDLNKNEERKAAYAWTYGPIKIDSDYWEYNNELKAGISEFYVYAIDKNNNEIQPVYTLVYDDYTKATDYKWKWHGTWQNAIPFTYENEKNYGNNHLNDPEVSDTKKLNEMIILNQISAQGKGFYIHFNQEIKSFRIVVNYKYLNAKVDLIPIKSADDYEGGPAGCAHHSNITFSETFGTDRDVIYVKGNNKYTYFDSQSQWTTATTSPSDGIYGGYYRVYDKFYNSQGVRHWVNGGILHGVATSSTYCPDCNAVLIDTNGNLVNNAVRVHKFAYSRYAPWTCSYNNSICGSNKTISRDSIQRLIVANPNLNEGIGTLEKNVIIHEEPPVVYTIEFKMEKYNINDLNSEEKEQASGATFDVIVKQGGQIIYSNTVTNNGIVSIPTTSTEDMFIKIEEKQAPNGYYKIQKQINYIVKYNTQANRFDPKFAPTESEWEQSGFDNTYGNWQHIDSDNDFPNTYRVEETGDTIEVDKKEGEPYVIKVYDEPKPINITLEKLNSYDSFTSGIAEHLDGAKFTLKAIQKNGNEFISLNITAGNNEATGTLENILANQLIQITPKYVDANKKVYITIEETEAPNGYIAISKPIIACYTYNSVYGIWDFKYSVTSTDDIDIFNNELDNSYVLWSWVQTESDKKSNGTYDSKLPNVYCVMNEANSSSTVLEEDMRENNTKDIIYVEQNTNNGGNTIKVFNTKNEFEISGNVWLDENTIINNKVKGAPNGKKDANENGIAGIKVSLYNRFGIWAMDTITDEDGNYSFTNIPYDENGYYVDFEYDGINYECDNIRDESKAWDIGRTEFNNKFHYILKDYDSYLDLPQDCAQDLNLSNRINLIYELSEANGVKTSKLKTKRWNPEENADELINAFKMHARTNLIKNTMINVNFGLVQRKPLDVALTTSIVNKNNIRIRNYTNNFMTFVNGLNNNNFAVMVNGDEAFVTYKVDLINQGAETASIDEIAYYYDEKFTFDLEKTVDMNNELNTVQDIRINNLDNPRTHLKALKVYTDDKCNLNSNCSKTIYLVFKTEVSNLNASSTFTNFAEIIKYSSEKGLVDKDSHPGYLNEEYMDVSNVILEDDAFKCEQQIIINN